MKHLLTGVAMAAVLAIAAPVWAQAPMTPAAPSKAPAASAPAKPMSGMPMAKKPMRKMMHHHHMMGSGDQMTEDLNRQELARITGGNTAPMPAPMAPAPMPGGNNPTSGTAGPLYPSGGNGMSAPPPAK